MESNENRGLSVSLKLEKDIFALFQKGPEMMKKLLDSLDGQFRTARMNWPANKLVFDFESKEKKMAFIANDIEMEVEGKKIMIMEKKESKKGDDGEWIVIEEEMEMKKRTYNVQVFDYPPPLRPEHFQEFLEKRVTGKREVKVDFLRKCGKHWMGGIQAQIVVMDGEWKPVEAEEKVKIPVTRREQCGGQCIDKTRTRTRTRTRQDKTRQDKTRQGQERTQNTQRDAHEVYVGRAESERQVR